MVLVLLWFGISVPLTFLGAFYGYKKRPIEHPVRTNTIPRVIPDQIFYTKPLPGIVMGGILPFGCIFIQLFFILNSLWSHQVKSELLNTVKRYILLNAVPIDPHALRFEILTDETVVTLIIRI